MNSKTRIFSSRAGATPMCERDRRVLQRVAQRANDNRAANKTSGPRTAAVLSAIRGLWPVVIGVPALALAWIGANLLMFAQTGFDLRLFLGLNLPVGLVWAAHAALAVKGRGKIGRLVPRHDGNMVREQVSEARVGDAPVRATLRAV